MKFISSRKCPRKSQYSRQHFSEYFLNFIPDKIVTFNNKDPTWITSNLKHKLNWKNGIDKDDLKISLSILSAATCNIRSISSNIQEKDEYHNQLPQKLNHPIASSETYWFILN